MSQSGKLRIAETRRRTYALRSTSKKLVVAAGFLPAAKLSTQVTEEGSTGCVSPLQWPRP